LTEVPFLTPSTIPTLLAIGENDRVVSVKAAHDFAAQGDSVTLKILHDARHELFMETDKIQNALWSAIDAFFEQIGV
jgi:alpha-beta hydrolase superfamily lysophospholipase